MFVRYFAELPFPFSSVEEALLRAPGEWVPGIARHAEDLGEHLLVDVGFGPEGRRVARSVIIELQDPVRFPSRTVLPMSWRAAEKESLYPKLDADIEVAPLGSDLTQISVSARYRPPMGPVGRAIDKTVLHRVAEATVKDFVDRAQEKLIALLEQPAGSSAAAGGPAD
jgi:hypothetical protein